MHTYNEKTMDTPSFDFKGLGLLLSGWVLNINSFFTKDNISFVAGLTATLLAIVHYIIQIKNNSKDK